MTAFKVSKEFDLKSGNKDAVEIEVPPAYIDAAKEKVVSKHFKPKLENGKPVEFFTYFYFTPKLPATVVTDLDQSLDKQP